MGTWKLVLSCFVHRFVWIDATPFETDTIQTLEPAMPHNRAHPAFRLAEVMGSHHQRSFERSLSEELHRRFDAITAETLPHSLSAVLGRLCSGSKKRVGPQRPPRAS
jgi:hypothetical protein